MSIPLATTASLLNICLFGAGLCVIKRLLDVRRSSQLPPGPAGWPLIGNLAQIPSEKLWEYLAALSTKHGDILSLNILGTRYVVLTSFKAISDILEKQSIKCSDRPRLIMASELVGAGKGMIFSNYTDRFRQSRKLFSRWFGGKKSIAAFNSLHENECRKFLRNVLRDTSDLANHIHSNACSVIIMAAYGYTVKEEKDPFVELANKVMAMTSEVAKSGAFMVDIIPALRYLPEWFPGAGFLQLAKEYRQLVMQAIGGPHQYVLQQMAAGTAIPSFSSTLLNEGVTTEEEDIIMWTSMDIYFCATDTIVTTMHSFFLAMVLFPEVQIKAQTELDTVVGTERLPSFDDYDSLPYVNALCKEVLRWHTVVPTGMPHVATEDIYYNGFLVPRGTYIIGNAWGILHDEKTYHEPHAFRPERFLGESPEPDPQNTSFGFGRRICPGRHFAEASIFISIAMSLSALNISKDIVDGVEITPTYDVTSGTISHVNPFRCRITARSDRAEALVHSLL